MPLHLLDTNIILRLSDASDFTHLLTFNDSDFSRYSGVVAIRPQDVVPKETT